MKSNSEVTISRIANEITGIVYMGLFYLFNTLLPRFNSPFESDVTHTDHDRNIYSNIYFEIKFQNITFHVLTPIKRYRKHINS